MNAGLVIVALAALIVLAGICIISSNLVRMKRELAKPAVSATEEDKGGESGFKGDSATEN